MSAPDDGPLAAAVRAERRDLGHADDDTDPDPTTLATGDGIAATRTHIDGEQVDLAEPRTQITFEDEHGLLSGEWGRPRPREFWTAKQLGQTPPMELIKITVTQQLTGGNPEVTDPDGDLAGPEADLADLIESIYQGPHFQELNFDNLITGTVSSLIDTAWAYWELLPSASGGFPVAGFKPLPALQMQHNVDPDTGELVDDPAFYQVPFKRSGGTIQTVGAEPVALPRESVVVMRDPQSTRFDSLYGESIATKVREWLELIIDVDVHQKRHYSDSQLPAGFLHFQGAIGDEKLQEVEQDIVEASGDPHDLVTVSSEDGASWIPVGESVVDLEAIQEQQWYFKLVLAAAGLNANELGVIEGSGFAKETPALQRAIYKKVTKPMMGAILQPQNHQVLPRIVDGFEASVDSNLELTIERFDPVQEQIEREEMLSAYTAGTTSLNEVRGEFGREAAEFHVEIDGEERNLADLPKDIVDLIKPELPSISLEDAMNGDGGEGEAMASHSEPGPPDFDADPVLSESEAFEELGRNYSPQAVRQLEDTVEVQSSFIATVAYSRTTEFLQLEFEREDGSTATYWYGSVPEYRFFNILRADSKGKYFNKYIRGEYYYARLN